MLSNKTEIFRSVLDQFETDEIKAFTEDLLELQDDVNMTMPSSTSYKFHNRTQCKPGGQAMHVLMVGTIMNYVLDLEYIQKEKFSDPRQRDCLRAAALLHDIKKTNGGKFTVHEHPLLAQQFVEETPVEHDIDHKYRKYIGGLCASHSGEWTTTKKSTTVLPEPKDDAHFLVHMCDYLSSRKNLDMTYEKEDKEKIKEEQPLPDINTYKLPFGKYKGKTLLEIKEENVGWIIWAKENIDSEPLATLLKEI